MESRREIRFPWIATVCAGSVFANGYPSSDVMQRELAIPKTKTVTIGLRSEDGTQHKILKKLVSSQMIPPAQINPGPSRTLDGNIGYIRIPQMDNRLTELIVDQIKEFRETSGLIIDVRNNSGGRYGILQAIYGFFVPDDAMPYVTNIAAYRLSHRFSKDHIAYRPTYRANWKGWSEAERKAIAAARTIFKPEWSPPKNKFSDWHYMLLSRQRHGRVQSVASRILGREKGNDYYYYDKPVVVLCNASSFSATDGFLSSICRLAKCHTCWRTKWRWQWCDEAFQSAEYESVGGIVVNGLLSCERKDIRWQWHRG